VGRGVPPVERKRGRLARAYDLIDGVNSPASPRPKGSHRRKIFVDGKRKNRPWPAPFIPLSPSGRRPCPRPNLGFAAKHTLMIATRHRALGFKPSCFLLTKGARIRNRESRAALGLRVGSASMPRRSPAQPSERRLGRRPADVRLDNRPIVGFSVVGAPLSRLFVPGASGRLSPPKAESSSRVISPRFLRRDLGSD